MGITLSASKLLHAPSVVDLLVGVDVHQVVRSSAREALPANWAGRAARGPNRALHCGSVLQLSSVLQHPLESLIGEHIGCPSTPQPLDVTEVSKLLMDGRVRASVEVPNLVVRHTVLERTAARG